MYYACFSSLSERYGYTKRNTATLYQKVVTLLLVYIVFIVFHVGLLEAQVTGFESVLWEYNHPRPDGLYSVIFSV